MALFGKKKAEKKEEEGEEPITDEEKAKNRGTSNTEALLVMTRQNATQQLQQAHKAEKSYKNKKRAASARENFKACKEHFKTAAKEFKAAFATFFRAIGSIGYVFGDKKDERRRNRAQAQRKKLEERLAKESGDDQEGDGEAAKE